jgi:hypothetical protein
MMLHDMTRKREVCTMPSLQESPAPSPQEQLTRYLRQRFAGPLLDETAGLSHAQLFALLQRRWGVQLAVSEVSDPVTYWVSDIVTLPHYPRPLTPDALADVLGLRKTVRDPLEQVAAQVLGLRLPGDADGGDAPDAAP